MRIIFFNLLFVKSYEERVLINAGDHNYALNYLSKEKNFMKLFTNYRGEIIDSFSEENI